MFANQRVVSIIEFANEFVGVGLFRSSNDLISGGIGLAVPDILRDGAMGGANVDATAALARAVDIPVIASGGVSSMEDLMALQRTGVIAGAISGRALYDGAIDLSQALAALKNT